MPREHRGDEDHEERLHDFHRVHAARDEHGLYVAYANSIVCSPWGSVLARAGTGEEILYADIDLAYADKIRAQLPVLTARKPELYRKFGE